MEQQPYGQQEVYEQEREKAKGVPLQEPRRFRPWIQFMRRKLRAKNPDAVIHTVPLFPHMFYLLTLHYLRVRTHEKIQEFKLQRADQQLVESALKLLIQLIQADGRTILDDEEVRGYAVSAVEAVCTAKQERVTQIHESRGITKEEYYDYVLTCILDEVTDYWSVRRRS